MLLKPEEVSKKPKKNKVLEVLGIGVVRILVFLKPPQVLARFSMKTLLKPEEVSKKPKSRGENVAKTLRRSQKNKKKNKVLEVFKARASQFLFFLRPPQVLARFSMKTLLKPEEVSKKNQKKKQSFGSLQSQGLSIFGFFETSSGFSNIFLENLAKT